MRLAPDDSSIPEQIEKWAKSNDWYDITGDPNQLKLEIAFWELIEKTASQLEYHSMGIYRRQLLDSWDLLMGKCRQLDVLCQAKCQTRKQVQELKCLRTKVTGIMNEIADLFRVIRGEVVGYSDTSESIPIPSQNQNSKVTNQLARQAEDVIEIDLANFNGDQNKSYDFKEDMKALATQQYLKFTSRQEATIAARRLRRRLQNTPIKIEQDGSFLRLKIGQRIKIKKE